MDIDWWNDPVKAAEAKRLAAGPAGAILSRHALHYAASITMGDEPRPEALGQVNTATATLLQLDGGVFAITCAHVLHAYRDWMARNERAIFQIADVRFNPLEQIASEDAALDLATLLLTDAQVRAIVRGDEIGSRVIQPARWPPRMVKVGEPLMFGGFPGKLRERVAHDEIIHGGFGAAGIRVAAARDTDIVCQLERDYWVASFGERGRDSRELTVLGGMSGGPAFVDLQLHWEFVGIIYEFSEAFDLMRFRPATLIRPDGSIRAP